MKSSTCSDRIGAHLQGLLIDLQAMINPEGMSLAERQQFVDDFGLDAHPDDEDFASVALDTFYEYGLDFGWIAPGTFGDQPQGYYRYQLSWGGPSDEFRFFVNPDLSCWRVEYWFLDWNDSAHVEIQGDDRDLLLQVWNALRPPSFSERKENA